MSPVFVWAAAGFLGLGALSALLMRLTSRVDPSFQRRYLLQAGLVALALLPAAEGPVVHLTSLLGIGVVCASEVAHVAGVAGWASTLLSTALLVLCCALLLFFDLEPSVIGLGAMSLLGLAAPWLVSRTRALDWPSARFALSTLWPACAIAGFMTLSTHPERLREVGFLYGVLEVSDSVAFIVGKSFGRRKLSPRLSPHKTWEGLLAGLLAASGAACAFSFCLPELSLLERAALGLMLALWGVAADLSVSVFKRARGVKDYGALLGPHGGLFDAYDSFLLTGPLWALLLKLYTSA